MIIAFQSSSRNTRHVGFFDTDFCDTARISRRRNWMNEFEYVSIAQMRGSMSQRNVVEPAAFERANYMKVLDSYREGGSKRA